MNINVLQKVTIFSFLIFDRQIYGGTEIPPATFDDPREWEPGSGGVLLPNTVLKVRGKQ